MATRYYMGFQASQRLSEISHRIVENREQGHKEPYAPMMNEFVSLMVAELLHSFLTETAQKTEITPRKIKIVSGAVDKIDGAVRFLAGKLIGDRSNKELAGIVAYMDYVYLPAAMVPSNQDTIACEISPDLYHRMRTIESELDGGNLKQIRKDLDKVLKNVVDAVTEGFMVVPLERYKFNFLLRKVRDGAVATCKTTAGLVVSKVFSGLEEQQLRQLAAHFDTIAIELDS